jgi:hypothetical protein
MLSQVPGAFLTRANIIPPLETLIEEMMQLSVLRCIRSLFVSKGSRLLVGIRMKVKLGFPSLPVVDVSDLGFGHGDG